jgi:hypothetical protein
MPDIPQALKKLPPFLRELLDTPPRAGEGVHAWLFNVARQLHAHLPAGEIITLLESKVANCGRAVFHAEIISAVQNSLPCAWQQSQRTPERPGAKWPDVNQKQRAAIVRDGGGLADLWELSPVRIEDNRQHTEEIVDKLFPGNPLLCCGKSISTFDTKPRTEERANGRALLNLLAGSYVIGSVPRAVFIMQAASDDTEDKRIVWTCCKNNDGELGARSVCRMLFSPRRANG